MRAPWGGLYVVEVGQGSLIGERYRIDEEIAHGGMGSVYRGLDLKTGRVVAIKRLLHAADLEHLHQFEREFVTLSTLHHPRIIEVYEYGNHRGTPFYTMELLDGRDLRNFAPLSVETACRHLRDVATSLALLHSRRLLHRDIKASNIRLTSDGRCKLFDFGALASFGVPARVIGTAPYLPPEAVRGAPLDQRSDLYALGALAYWLLTRRHAYRARELEELPALWRRRALPPSKIQPGISRAVDRLVLSLLDPDPAARPNSAAEVVELLNALANLPEEDEQTQHALGRSYLATPALVARESEASALAGAVRGLASSAGAARILRGTAGTGRTRLLDEIELKSRMAGVPTVRVDASMHGRARGTSLAIVGRLLEQSDQARRAALVYKDTLTEAGIELADAAQDDAGEPGPASGWSRLQEILVVILKAAAREAPLLLLVDNADEADEASLGLLVAAARLTKERPMATILATRPPTPPGRHWAAIAEEAEVLELGPLSMDGTQQLVASIFGQVPNATRLAQWLFQRTGGLPLHCLEALRVLHTDGTLRFRNGQWSIPNELDDDLAASGLDPLIERHLESLSADAYALAESVSTCRPGTKKQVWEREGEVHGSYQALDELLRKGILVDTQWGYAFTNSATRQAVIRRMTADRSRALHRKAAQDILDGSAARSHTPINDQIDAGWHLLQAGEEVRGAELMASAAYDSVGVRMALADLQVVAPALETALEIYTRQGRSLLERAPLLAALAQAGYYEHRRWATKYGDEAVAACEEVTGLRSGRRLQRYLGKTLGLACGMLGGWLRYVMSPKRERRCSFSDLIVQLLGVVTTQTAVAVTALDGDLARRRASVLSPFMHLPDWVTFVGVGQYCESLCNICTDDPAAATHQWETLLRRFLNPRYYPSLPQDARPLYTSGLYFAKGVFEAFKEGDDALASADSLDALGIPMYRMVTCEIRRLYYACRGQVQEAEAQASLAERYSVEFGSASQVELWVPAAMILPYVNTGYLVGLRRVAQQLLDSSDHHPCLARYATLASFAAEHVAHDRSAFDAHTTISERLEVAEELARDHLTEAEPRAFVGWGALAGHLARNLNRRGDFRNAQDCCRRVLEVLYEEDRGFTTMFLPLEVELAVANAGLGKTEESMHHLNALMERLGNSNNPVTRGTLHDGYCRAAALAGRWQLYHHHLEAAKDHYRATEFPSLAARSEALAGLDRSSNQPGSSSPAHESRRPPPDPSSRDADTRSFRKSRA